MGSFGQGGERGAIEHHTIGKFGESDTYRELIQQQSRECVIGGEAVVQEPWGRDESVVQPVFMASNH